MAHRDRIEAFRARFGLTSDENAFGRLRTRIVQAARESVRLLRDDEHDELEREFAFRNGSRYVHANNWGAGGAHGIIEEFEQAESHQQLIERIQHLLWAFEKLSYFESKARYGDQEWAGILFAAKLSEAIDLSPGTDLRLNVTAGRAELEPAGVPLLDDAAHELIQWLARFPDVQKEFRQALAILSEKRSDQFRQAQDSLRFALEKLLKLLLCNQLRLEDQGKQLKEWLALRGVHESLRDVAVQIMMLLSKQYQNAAVKHDNAVGAGEAKAWQPFEVEYVIYQYATLFRLLSEAEGIEPTHNTTKESSLPTA